MKKEIILLYVFGAGIVLFLLTKIFYRLGIFKSKSKREIEASSKELLKTQVFNPQNDEKKIYKQLPVELAKQYAKDFRKAVRGIGTKETLIYSTIKKMYNQMNLAQVGREYYSMYKRDLKSDLLDDLRSKKERATLNALIKSLPEKS